MCKHHWIKVLGLPFCKKCGLVVLADGTSYIDKELIRRLLKNEKSS